jgi:hypothetical protein
VRCSAQHTQQCWISGVSHSIGVTHSIGVIHSIGVTQSGSPPKQGRSKRAQAGAASQLETGSNRLHMTAGWCTGRSGSARRTKPDSHPGGGLGLHCDLHAGVGGLEVSGEHISWGGQAHRVALTEGVPADSHGIQSELGGAVTHPPLQSTGVCDHIAKPAGLTPALQGTHCSQRTRIPRGRQHCKAHTTHCAQCIRTRARLQHAMQVLPPAAQDSLLPIHTPPSLSSTAFAEWAQW